MSYAIQNRQIGGDFLFKELQAEDIFIPEDWDEEQRLIGATCSHFIEHDVIPNLTRIDEQEEGLLEGLIKKAGDLGLLAISLPEEYNGFGKDLVTSMLVAERTGPAGSFSIAFMVHTGVGTLPILYYGNEQQKRKYLPKLSNGEWKGAYCLTEPEAGSDANAGKTRATLSADGKSYILNGQKMWITNAGFADIFIVFAKIDDDEDLSAFIVEKGFPGIVLNSEEQKMGLKGSSTRQMFFNNCHVPVENLLFDSGKGFKIAVNILNLGRIKLGAVSLGYAKFAITDAVRYANYRHQFGQPISEYGAIRYKLAEQVISAYATESAIYRVTQNIEDATQALIREGVEPSKAKLKATESFAMEAAIVKVHASEALNFIVDEAVQIHGGMGYSSDASVNRAFRDSRVYRIFEGTNEINRILIVNVLFKKALKLRDIGTASGSVAEEKRKVENKAVFETMRFYVANFKKATLMVAKAMALKFEEKPQKEQELQMFLADMLIETYVSESLALRVEKLAWRTGQSMTEHVDIMQVHMHEAAYKIFKAGKEAILSFVEGDERVRMLDQLMLYTQTELVNTTEARRRIASKLIGDNQYRF